MPDANERISPIVYTGPIHLHERTGFGLAGQAKKDPTNSIYYGEQGERGENGLTFYPPISGGFPPITLLPPLEVIPPPEFTPITFPESPPPIPADSPPAFPFILAEGAWWAPVTVDENGATVDPYWIPFAPLANLRYRTDTGNVEYWDGSAWTSWSSLPTSDPGGGAIWLSAT